VSQSLDILVDLIIVKKTLTRYSWFYECLERGLVRASLDRLVRA